MQLSLQHPEPAAAMAEFEQILASNSGEDPFDSAIKLLAAKLVDECDGDGGGFSVQKTPDATHRSVQSLYRKAVRKWPQLNGNGDALDISPEHLVRSMRPLIGWKLIGSDLSWLDATLERLVARDSKGALGQYFTPRDVIRFCIEILNPGPKDKVIDPACGSGGFLFEATLHSLKEVGTAPQCLGIDFGARAIKVAALLAAATPKSKISISKGNSIDGRAYATRSIPEWKDFLCKDSGSSTPRAKDWGEWNRLGCTVLATNPPFAGDIDELEILDAYESQKSIGLRGVVSREHLFLERAVDLLRPNGRLAIVLPQGLLANSSASYLRKWLFDRCRVLGVIGLHPHSFLPYTSVKTSLLFVAKHSANEPLDTNYDIFFATSKRCGKDGRGRQTEVGDYDEIREEFLSFLSARGFDWSRYSGKSKPFRSVTYKEVLAADRLDAEYFDSEARDLLRKIEASAKTSIGELVESQIQRFRKGQFNEIHYIDISCVDSESGVVSSEKIRASDAPSRATYLVQAGDVLVSTVRPERNVVGLVTDAIRFPAVASSGFCVLRPKSVEPEVLFAYCKTEAFRSVLSRHATASMYPTVTDRDVLRVPFVEPTNAKKTRVKDLVQTGLDMITKGQNALAEAGKLMEQQQSGSQAIAATANMERQRYKVRKKR